MAKEKEKEMTYILLDPADIGTLMRYLTLLLNSGSLSMEHQRGMLDDRHLLFHVPNVI